MSVFTILLYRKEGLDMAAQMTAGMRLGQLQRVLEQSYQIQEKSSGSEKCEWVLIDPAGECTKESLEQIIQSITGSWYRVEVTVQDAGNQEPTMDHKESAAKTEDVNSETSGQALSEIVDRIHARVGNEEFKELAAELSRIGDRLSKIPGYFSKNTYLFAIDSGYGVTTALLEFAELARQLKLISSDRIGEINFLTDTTDPKDIANMEASLRDALRGNNERGLICINLSNCFDALKRAEYRQILRTIFKERDGLLVFRVPFLEEHVLQQVEAELSDLFYIHTVRFAPFTMNQLMTCAQSYAKEQGFVLHENMRAAVETMVAQEKSDGRFYGIQTMQKIVNQLIYEKVRHGYTEESPVITIEDIDGMVSGTQNPKNSAEERLRGLIGMEHIADQINEIVSLIEFSKKSDTDRPALHMRFVGPPGTGKTTVARLLGEILKEHKILRTGVFFEHSGNDFIAKYVGHTAAKTAQICRDAYGGVLFIDEAYSLAFQSDRSNGSDSFRQEAMNTLLEQMENHRDDMVVIMAGYETEMDILMQSNPGLANRLPYVVRFERYSKEQLAEIFYMHAEKKFCLNEELKEHIRQYFLALPNNVYYSPTFANGRFVRNLYERVVSKAALRARFDGEDSHTLLIEDFEKARREIEYNMTASMKYGQDDSGATMFSEENSMIRFQDVCGEGEAKELLMEMVDFVKNPAKYQKIGAVTPKGALLCGPPGTGKTMLVRAAAGEAGIPVLTISGSDLVSKYVGEGTEKVRRLFQQAKKLAPCIVFIDEIDAIGASRGRGGDSTTLIQLLTEMDGFNGRQDIMMLAATNQPEILDPALKRPGRFDREIPVELPTLEGRMEILRHYLEATETEENIDLREIANLASGMSGADLKNVVNEAALKAVRENREKIRHQDLEESIEIVMVGHRKKGMVMSEREKWSVCYHEIGHALAAALQTNSAPVKKITILPRTGGTLGYAMQLDPEERFLYTKTELLNRIVTITAGRAAEEVHFGEVTTGASNDIEKATRIAQNIVMRYGMTDLFDMTSLEAHSGGYLGSNSMRSCSDETVRLADQAVVEIVREQHQRALKLLKDNEKALDHLAEFIYEKETITGDEFMEILHEMQSEQ